MAAEARARRRRFASWVASLSVAALVRAANAAPDSGVSKAPEGSVESYFSALVLGLQKSELDNGLKVVLNVERGAPLIAVSLTVRTGHAHASWLPELVDVLRHQRAVSGSTDHDLVRARGAVSYRSAGWEHSTFTEMLPADELPFALWLEGQRLQPLPELPASARNAATHWDRAFSLLEPERRALFELERAAWAPAPGQELGVKLLNDCCFTPAPAVLTLTGDFDSDEALRLVGEHIAEGSRAPQPPPASRSSGGAPGAAGLGETDLAHTAPGVSSAPELSVGFDVPGAQDTSHAAVTLAAELLERAGGSLGPVFGGARAPVKRIELGEARGRSLLAIHLSRRAPGGEALTPKSIFDALGRVARRPLSEPELAVLRKAALIRWLTQFASLQHKSELLGRYEVLHGDARLVARYASDLADATASDVRRVLATLTADRAVVVQAGALRKVAP